MLPFPRIQRPCPYLDRLDEVIEQDFCRMCKREVHDLTHMDEGRRADFLAACGGDVCVKYTAMLRPAVAAAAVAASVAAFAQPALAQDHRARRVHAPSTVVLEPPMVAVVLGGAPVPPRDPPPPPRKADEPSQPAPPPQGQASNPG